MALISAYFDQSGTDGQLGVTVLADFTSRWPAIANLVARFDNSYVRFSESFSDAEKLLAECERLGLEGIVSKRADLPYRAGRCDWVKVKTKAWREANRDRRELFK